MQCHPPDNILPVSPLILSLGNLRCAQRVTEFLLDWEPQLRRPPRLGPGFSPKPFWVSPQLVLISTVSLPRFRLFPPSVIISQPP
jgi:hypothetical protein